MKILRAILSCDLRSLAAFRVVLGITALCHFAHAPRVLKSANSWSVYSISDNSAYHAILVLLTYGALICFTIGYRTRLSSFCAWALLASGHAAMGFLYSDPLLLSFLILGTILPLGNYLSVDAAMDQGFTPHDGTSETVVRNGQSQWFTRTALTVYVVLILASTMVFASPHISTIAFAIVAIPVLAIAPLRTLALLFAVGWLMLANVELAQNVSCLSSIAGLTALLPGWAWERLSGLPLFSRRHQLRIYFDEPCGFCRKICYLFCSFMLLGDAKVAPAQSDPDTLKLLRTHDSWVVYDADGQYYLHWHAVILLLTRSPLWWPVGYLLKALHMGYWGKPLYRAIGYSRTALSNITSVVLPYRPLPQIPIYIDAVAAVMWLSILLSGTLLFSRTTSETLFVLLSYVGALHM